MWFFYRYYVLWNTNRYLIAGGINLLRVDFSMNEMNFKLTRPILRELEQNWASWISNQLAQFASWKKILFYALQSSSWMHISTA